MSIEVMKQALEALDCIYSPLHVREIEKVGSAMSALRTAIEQAEKQEPEEWDERCVLGHCGSPTGCELSNRCRADPPPAAPVQEPSTRACRSCGGSGERDTGIAESPIAICKPCAGTGQITTPPAAQRQWVGLTDEEYAEAEKAVWAVVSLDDVEKEANREFYQAIEAKLREKNGGQA